MNNDIEMFREKILAEIQEYKEYVEKDNKLTYDEKIQKLSAIVYIQETVKTT